ncbi:MAG: hypothetical protein WDN49_08140 [Acetobacteraceae bacterium]
MRRALTNLVDNSRRHARHIAVSAVPQERSIHVLVTMTGRASS